MYFLEKQLLQNCFFFKFMLSPAEDKVNKIFRICAAKKAKKSVHTCNSPAAGLQ